MNRLQGMYACDAWHVRQRGRGRCQPSASHSAWMASETWHRTGRGVSNDPASHGRTTPLTPDPTLPWHRFIHRLTSGLVLEGEYVLCSVCGLPGGEDPQSLHFREEVIWRCRRTVFSLFFSFSLSPSLSLFFSLSRSLSTPPPPPPHSYTYHHHHTPTPLSTTTTTITTTITSRCNMPCALTQHAHSEAELLEGLVRGATRPDEPEPRPACRVRVCVCLCAHMYVFWVPDDRRNLTSWEQTLPMLPTSTKRCGLELQWVLER